VKTLYQSLLDYDMALLRAIAQRRGISLPSNRRREAVQVLSEALAQPEAMARIWEELNPEEREALLALARAGGRMSAAVFTRRFGEVRPMGPGRLAREQPWCSPMSPAEGLWYAGLIYRAFAPLDEQGPMVEFVYIPTDLLPLLPEAQPTPPPFPVEPVPPPAHIRPGTTALVEDVCAFLGFCQTVEVRPGRDGSLPSSVVTALERRFLEPDAPEAEQRRGDPPRLSFLRHLCHRLGLIHLRGGRLKPSPDPAQEWLQAGRGEQLRRFQEAWRDDPHWNELWRVPSLRCEDTGWRNDPRAARRRLLSHLARCPVDQWLSISSFIAAVKATDPDWLRPDGDYDSWYIRDAASGRYLMGFAHWDQVEGRLIAYFLIAPLHWLGIVSLGYSGEESAPASGCRSFRLTPWGAAFLGLGAPPADPPSQPLHIQPDLTVLVPGTASQYDRFQLSRIAQWEATGDPHRYRLTQESIGRALQQRIPIDRILSFLERASGGQIPSNVTATLRAWAARFGQVRLRRALILETASPRIMQELQALPRTRACIKKMLSPTTALVSEEDAAELQAALRELGYLLDTG